MSAPHEVFVVLDAEKWAYKVCATEADAREFLCLAEKSEREDYQDDTIVRYIRSDLTCGECAIFQTLKCAHRVDVDHRAVMSHSRATPACMLYEEPNTSRKTNP
jgi:hypothetical protein